MLALVELLRPYVEATTLDEAERALDELAVDDSTGALVIGDCYDDLAEVAAEDGDYERAACLEQRAVEIGCRYPKLAREMLGWYLLKSGSVAAGESIFAELRSEHPADVELLVTIGHARSDAGLHGEALAALDDAVIVAKRGGAQRSLDRARIERQAEREHLGLPPDEDDRLAPAPRPLISERVEWALAWFPPDQQAAALARWPTLEPDLADPSAYARRLEGNLRELHRETGQRPTIAALDVDDLSNWAAEHDYDADSGAARSQFAAELARAGRAHQWPPGRNDGCWCQSGRKYKRCCGAD